MLYAAAVFLFVVDRALKLYALASPTTRPLAPFVNFALFKNTGLVASLPVPAFVYWMVSMLGIVGLVGILLFIIKKQSAITTLLLTVILLGALSNSFDRIAYRATIDYLIFFNRSAVNIADGMIIAGVIALLWPKKLQK